MPCLLECSCYPNRRTYPDEEVHDSVVQFHARVLAGDACVCTGCRPSRGREAQERKESQEREEGKERQGRQGRQDVRLQVVLPVPAYRDFAEPNPRAMFPGGLFFSGPASNLIRSRRSNPPRKSTQPHSG